MSGNWMQTYSGGQFHPLAPQQSEVKVLDIAHSLSMMCRFTGHCLKFFSVAQHSVMVARLVKGDAIIKLQALFHDASEAYIVDIPRPLKHSEEFSFYRKLEDKVQSTIFMALGLPTQLPIAVKYMDELALYIEARDNMRKPCDPWGWSHNTMSSLHLVPDDKLKCWSPARAKREFLLMYMDLRAEISDWSSVRFFLPEVYIPWYWRTLRALGI